jgi:hypothetical protein
MRFAFALLLALAIVPARAEPPHRYALEWHSALPIDTTTIHATITGGTLVSTVTTQDATMGWVTAEAPRACVTIAMTAQTTTGVLVRASERWDADCDRLWLPMVGARAGLAPAPAT